MELIEAYHQYRERIKKESLVFREVVDNQDCMILSTLLFLKTYREYILTLSGKGRSPRIKKVSEVSIVEGKRLNNLMESCVAIIDSFQLDPKNIIIKDDDLTDPYTLINIILKDYLSPTLSSDEVYEKIVRSIFNIIIDGDFERILKDIFLKFIHMKK